MSWIESSMDRTVNPLGSELDVFEIVQIDLGEKISRYHVTRPLVVSRRRGITVCTMRRFWNSYSTTWEPLSRR